MKRRGPSPDSASNASPGRAEEQATLSRRDFVALLAAASVTASALGATDEQVQNVYIVPNFHPASCGWLTTFSRERVYCANSYLTHLDRVDTDPHYAFVLSEINNIIAIMNFRPERIADLKKRVAEKRVELVNGMFLEPTINLSGGEALVRMGVLGLRWYEQVFGLRPRYAWTIDVCGTHEQMAQIASGLGLDAMIYTRKNPTGKSMFWSVSPDGSKILTLSPGHYSEAGAIFSAKTELNSGQLEELDRFFSAKEKVTPEGAPILILGGGDDYSCAPVVKDYPSTLLSQWQALGSRNRIRFTTLSEYVDAVLPGIHSGQIAIPTTHAGTAYDFDAFWIENPEVKTRYRRNEQSLQATEMLSTIASMHGSFAYPVRDLYHAWVLMCLNMDRNTLWGSAGGMVFVSDTSWDVRDRFDWVGATTSRIFEMSGKTMLPKGTGLGLFNPLNWQRKDPIALTLAASTIIEGLDCEAMPDGTVLCSPALPAFSIGGLQLSKKAPALPESVDPSGPIETDHYTAQIDLNSGALSSLRLKPSGRELLAGPSNVIVAERPIKEEPNPGDYMAARPGRTRVASSGDQQSAVRMARGPVATTVEVTGRFCGGPLLRRIRFYHTHPRIDFETELNDVPNSTAVVAEFPLAGEVTEIRRGIPYGFAHSGWARPDPALPGWNKGIVPAVRWMDFELAGGGGVALLDRGLTGREINGNTPILYLLNAVDEYHKFPNAWTSGRGRHLLPYALFPHTAPWEQAAVTRSAWEYNQLPIVIADSTPALFVSYLETSENIIVEAIRREQNRIEMRFAESLGVPGTAMVKLNLPHGTVHRTDLNGHTESAISGRGTYTIPLAPQQIVTLHFKTEGKLPLPEPLTSWEEFVPERKKAALHAYDPNVKGHPPFGGGSMDF